MNKVTDPLIAECDAFMHATTALAGMIALRLAAINPKGVKDYMLPVPSAIMVDRLRMVNMEVVGVRVLARALRDDIASGGLGGVAGGGTGAPQGGGTSPKGEPAERIGEPGDLDAGLRDRPV